MLAHLGDDTKPIHLGQHAVDDRHVIGPRQRKTEAHVTIGGIVHHMAGLFQALNQIALRLQIVLDYENTHAISNQRFKRVPAGGGGGTPAGMGPAATRRPKMLTACRYPPR